MKSSSRKQRFAAALGGLLLLAATPAMAEAPSAQLRPIAPGAIAIDWQHSNDHADGITVQREAPGFVWTFLVLTGTFADLGLEASHTYRYRVCAVYGQTPECTSWLAAQTMPPQAAPNGLEVPRFTGATATMNSITANWTSSWSYDFYNIRFAENWLPDAQFEVSGRSFTADFLRPGTTYHFIVQGCNDGIFKSGCSTFSAPYEVMTASPPPPPPPPPPASKGVIYALNLNDDLMWYRHDGRSDGRALWSFPEGKQIGNGWAFKKIFASAGAVYAVHDNGELVWYRHVGREDGSFRWQGPKTVGWGWGPAAFKELFPGGDGIIYGIRPVKEAGFRADGSFHKASGGELVWYRHVGQQDGSVRWEGPRTVGTGWAGFKKVFSGGDGVIYAIKDNGDLMWARHLGRSDGTFRWQDWKLVGTGWGAFTKVFSGGGGDGVLYATQDNGDLLWFRHDGRNDGSFTWARGSGNKVASGWYKFTFTQLFTD